MTPSLLFSPLLSSPPILLLFSFTFPSASLHEGPLSPGHQFMIDLLVGSFMVERGVEDALVSSIAGEVHEATLAGAPNAALDSSVPLLQLMQKLIANATILKLATLKQVSGLSGHAHFLFFGYMVLCTEETSELYTAYALIVGLHVCITNQNQYHY